MDLKLNSMLKMHSIYATKKNVQISLFRQPTVGHEFNPFLKWGTFSWCQKSKTAGNLNSKKQDIRKEKPSNRQYDWTYQTSYKGSIRGEKSVKSDPGALCDLENLKKRETIGWYRDIRLYDDELDDNGAVSLGVKIRVMPSCFFILVRYYLRVDKGKASDSFSIFIIYLLY